MKVGRRYIIMEIDPSDRCYFCEVMGISRRPVGFSFYNYTGDKIGETEQVCPTCGDVTREASGYEPELG